MTLNADPGGNRPRGGRLAQAASSGRQEHGRQAPLSGRDRRAARAAKKAARAAAAGPAPTGLRRIFNYPRRGKGPIHRWIPSWRFCLGSFLLMTAAVLGLFVYAYSTIKVPEPSEFAQAQTTTVYYSDGTTPMGQFAEVNRTIIDTSTIPSHVGNAVVASEDRSFYTNSGVDPKGILRALVNNASGGGTQGASTLTQQYIKNYYVDTTSSYTGKFKQAIMALKIDRSKTKAEILGSYLNTVYFGRAAYGIEAASQAYFGHPASEMTFSESALLAGILPAPSAWDPAIDKDQATLRWKRVLDLMVADGYITQAERDSATFPTTIDVTDDETYQGPNGYLLQMVREELTTTAGLTDQQIDTGGLSIVTTINKGNQDAAVAAAQSLPEGHSPNLRVGLVSIDASSGGILSLYGGSDYLTGGLNSSTGAVAQAGSTFKPFALVAALENGATLANGYPGTSPMTIEGTQFVNFGDAQFKWASLVTATAYSVNTPYVQLNEDVGPETTKEVATRAGYPEDTAGLKDANLQNVLGSASPHTIDIATAYATFASQGTRHQTHIVASVSGKSVSYTAPTNGEKVFSDDVMADATYAMQQVVNEGSGTTALRLGRPIAAKTGSSSDNKSAQFVGYTPQVATAVTLYQTGPNGEEESITPWGEYSEITGSTYPADIFTTYMESALDGLPVEQFPQRTAESYTPGSLGGAQAPAPSEDSSPAPEPEPSAAPVEPTQEAPTRQAPTQDQRQGLTPDPNRPQFPIYTPGGQQSEGDNGDGQENPGDGNNSPEGNDRWRGGGGNPQGGRPNDEDLGGWLMPVEDPHWNPRYYRQYAH